MSASPNPTGFAVDAFTKFWNDVASRMTTAGFMPQAGGGDSFKQMQRIFFDAMSKYADDFLRSPQFLETLKTSMDNAMAFRRQVDGFITNAMRAANLPAPEDTADTIARLHSFERRMIERFDELNARIAALESGRARGKPSRSGAKKMARSSSRRGPKRTSRRK